ncbi:MAG: LrgB family protein [Desulfovibrio sp.]|jgi:predicted murein hydrolase (TIGR00659 family)|nr:LrgB family protein [Desulfovibrio sp.]
MSHLITLFFILLTMIVYTLARRVYFTYKCHPLLNIVAWSVSAIIGFLLIFDIPYKKYAPAKDIIFLMLGPATVGLALPLYRYRAVLKRRAAVLIGSVAVGSLLTMLSATLISKIGGLPREVVISIMPKGVSVPFTLEISQMYGGVPALAAAFVVATGTLGAVIGGWQMTFCGIIDPVARGLAHGTAAHAQGTATALIEGEQQGAMAGLAMILAGILTAVFSPMVVFLLDAV